MKKHGIDVSKHQGVIDWTKVKASGKVDFAMLRAGYGRTVSQKDIKFDRNYEGCVTNNIPKGVYWYSYAKTVAEAVEEANACLQVLNGKKLEYPVYWDFEEKSQINTGKANVSAMADAFCSTIEKAGYKAGVYSMVSALRSYITDDIKNKYSVWVAHVKVNATSYTGHDMWQYSWVGRINGISGDVDCNYCYKDFTNETSTTPTTPLPTKTVDELAQEVLDGKWGDADERKRRLNEAGYSYTAVQNAVNAILAKQKLQNAPKLQNHVVKKGDTLSAIAKKYGTTVDTILANNKKTYPKITKNYILIGWILRV